MKKYRVVTMNDMDTGSILFFCVLYRENKKWNGLAEDGKIKEFKTKLEAKEYCERFLNSENPNSGSNQAG